MKSEDDVRDELAKEAMAVLLRDDPDRNPQRLAERSYEIANAMIEERREHVTPEPFPPSGYTNMY